MNVEKLARMANQIAANFEYGANKVQAVAGIADHLLRFWTPEMRAELAEGHARGTVELVEAAALALTTATQPGARPRATGTGGDAG
jgi:formate dehydrogenase subunit delta